MSTTTASPSSGTGNGSKASSLADALGATRPPQAYHPAPAPSPKDVEGLHTRITAYLAAGHPIVAREAPDAVARLERLAANSGTLLDAIEQLKGRVQGAAAADGKKPKACPVSSTMSVEEEVARLVKRHVKAGTEGRYAVARPPPTVSDREVERAVAALTVEERKTLEGEFEMTCLEDFEWMSDPDELFAMERTTPTAATSESIPAATAQPEEVGGGEGGKPPPAPATVPGYTLEPQKDSTSTLLQPEAGDTPGFTLEAMPPATEGDDMGADARVMFGPTGACTVEVEYTMDRWAHDAESAPALARESNGFMVSLPVASAKEVASGDAREGEDEEAPPSFEKFSRFILQQRHEDIRARVQREAEASTKAAVPPPAPAPAAKEMSQPEAQRSPTALADGPVAVPQRDKQVARQREAFIRQRVRDVLLANKVESRERDRIALDVLMEVHTEVQGASQAALPTMERLAVLVKESQVLLSALDGLERSAVSERLTDSAQFLLVPRLRTTCYNITCGKAFSALVPREGCRRCGQIFCPQCCKDRGLGPSVVCDGKAVSPGWQPLCHACFTLCEENQRKVTAERKRRRLLKAAEGTAARDSPVRQHRQPHQHHQQASLYQPEHDREREQQQQQQPGVLLESDDASEVSATADARGHHDSPSAMPAASPLSIEHLSVKEAVLFGAYCGDTRKLSDGLPPFYVATSADETAAYWDVVTYRLAKLKGLFLAQYQLSGQAMRQVVRGAAAAATNNVHTLMPRRAMITSARGAATGNEVSEKQDDDSAEGEEALTGWVDKL